MRELSSEEINLVSGGMDFSGRRTSDNVVDGNSLQHYIDLYGSIAGPMAWAMDQARR